MVSVCGDCSRNDLARLKLFREQSFVNYAIVFVESSVRIDAYKRRLRTSGRCLPRATNICARSSAFFNPNFCRCAIFGETGRASRPQIRLAAFASEPACPASGQLAGKASEFEDAESLEVYDRYHTSTFLST